MPLCGSLRQMRKQNYAERGGGRGDNRGRRDLMHLEFRAFSSPTRWKREEIIKKWSKCTGRWAAGAAGGRLHAACVSHDWYRHQSPPERLPMKQLSRIRLRPDTVCFYYFFFPPKLCLFQLWWERTDTMMTTPPRPFWGILQGFPFFPGQNAASGSQHSRSSLIADASLFMRRWCESMSGDEENSQPVTQGSNSKAIWLQLTWILKVHLK